MEGNNADSLEMEGSNEDSSMMEMKFLQQQLGDDLQYPPLWHLLERQHTESFKSLLDHALNCHPPRVDVNHFLGHPICMRFLDKAASDNQDGLVGFLLDRGANPNLVNEEHKRAPIHFAAEQGHAAALAELLRDPQYGVNLNLEVGGSTALHWAVKAGSEVCVEKLLEAGASASLPNSKGLTALHLAAQEDRRAIVELILDKSPRPFLLDTYRDRNGKTARMVIEDKYPDLQLPEKSSNDQPDPKDLLRYFLGANDEPNFLEKLNSLGNPETELSDVRKDLLLLSVKQNLRNCLIRLIERGLRPELSELPELGEAALSRAHPDILRELLKNSPNLAETLLLPACRELGAPAKPGPGNRNNRLECLRIILERQDVDVRQEDEKGNSPLHYATRAECREAVDLLLQRGSYIGHTNAYGSSALTFMEPAQLKAHLDSCLTSSRERNEDYEIVMDYSNLVPHEAKARPGSHPGDDNRLIAAALQNGNGHCKATKCGPSDGKALHRQPKLRCETEALLYMANHKHMRPLLKHPLISSFLYLKFLRIRHWLYLNFILYFIFFFSLNVYIFVVCAKESTRGLEDGNSKNIQSSWSGQPLLSGLLLASLLYMVVRELLQLASAPLHYVTSAENWLELVLTALTGALLLHGSDPESSKSCKEIGALATLISTWQLICLIAQHPQIITWIEMFKTVTFTFVKRISLYVLLIFAFAFSFFVLFQGAKSGGDDDCKNATGASKDSKVIFSSVNASVFKTVVMLTGEFEADDLPFDTSPLVGRLVFFGFIFFVFMILLNLLNGLAVSDTAMIIAEAELVGLSAQARLLAYAECVTTGSPYYPKGWLASLLRPCCDGLTNRVCLVRPLMGLLARQLMLFPHLPGARLSVRPLSNYEMKPALNGEGVGMDKEVIAEVKVILAERARESDEDRILARLEALGGRLAGVETALRELLAVRQPRTDSS